MPAKKSAKTKKPLSKPAASKAVAVKKKPVVASKVKSAAKQSSKPKPAAKSASKTVDKKVAKSVVKPVAKVAAKRPAKAPVILKSKSVSKVAVKPPVTAATHKPTAGAAKPAATTAHKPAAAAKPSATPTTKTPGKAPVAASNKSAAAPKAAAIPLTPPTPIRSAVAVKSSVPELKKDLTPANDEDSEQSDSYSLLAGPRNVKPYQLKRDEDYMNPTQLNHFRTILQSWKKDLMQEVDRTVLHMQDEASNFPDPNDRATQESEFSLELRTRDRERKLIRKIEEALNRIEDGSYGYCVETGEEIGVKRLEARPVATLCVEAQERRERRERQYGDRDDRYR